MQEMSPNNHSNVNQRDASQAIQSVSSGQSNTTSNNSTIIINNSPPQHYHHQHPFSQQNIEMKQQQQQQQQEQLQQQQQQPHSQLKQAHSVLVKILESAPIKQKSTVSAAIAQQLQSQKTTRPQQQQSPNSLNDQQQIHVNQPQQPQQQQQQTSNIILPTTQQHNAEVLTNSTDSRQPTHHHHYRKRAKHLAAANHLQQTTTEAPSSGDDDEMPLVAPPAPVAIVARTSAESICPWKKTRIAKEWRQQRESQDSDDLPLPLNNATAGIVLPPALTPSPPPPVQQSKPSTNGSADHQQHQQQQHNSGQSIISGHIERMAIDDNDDGDDGDRAPVFLNASEPVTETRAASAAAVVQADRKDGNEEDVDEAYDSACECANLAAQQQQHSSRRPSTTSTDESCDCSGDTTDDDSASTETETELCKRFEENLSEKEVNCTYLNDQKSGMKHKFRRIAYNIVASKSHWDVSAFVATVWRCWLCDRSLFIRLTKQSKRNNPTIQKPTRVRAAQ